MVCSSRGSVPRAVVLTWIRSSSSEYALISSKYLPRVSLLGGSGSSEDLPLARVVEVAISLECLEGWVYFEFLAKAILQAEDMLQDCCALFPHEIELR